MTDEKEIKDYIHYDIDGEYGGAKELLVEEWAHIKSRNKGFDQNNIKGLALSGGGIRSASFCLGVVQALAEKSKLEKFDYLSTVSGGGYLGASLSWLWSGLWKDKEGNHPNFDATSKHFPFGTTGQNFTENNADNELNGKQASLLRHLRQHGKYLTPGKGITAFSFISIILRSLVMGFVSFFVFVCLLFSLLYAFGLIRILGQLGGSGLTNFFYVILATSVGLYIFSQCHYMWSITNSKNTNKSEAAYAKRRQFETILPRG